MTPPLPPSEPSTLQRLAPPPSPLPRSNPPTLHTAPLPLRAAVAALLTIHASLLAWQSWRYSPTIDEPAHLVAGISHWKFDRFDLYRVNPPLVRLVAALPMLVVDPKIDWSGFAEAPYDRPEFSIGPTFANSNGFDIFWYFTLARWVCIPFSLVGGYFCYRWARDLYGALSGLMALTLWCFCPNVLGNGALITPDVAATSFGVMAAYYFWRWLRTPGWLPALIAGITLGLAELTKSTWIILFALWPALWLIWTLIERRRGKVGTGESEMVGGLERGRVKDGSHDLRSTIYDPRGTPINPPPSTSSSLLQLASLQVLALYLLNLGYGFENSFQRLDKFQFISRSLGGPDAHEKPGNRFAGSPLAAVPVPVPANYLFGIDVQRYDFEKKKWSYLRGQHKLGGWWYYYLYAMAVKVPAGTLFLFALTCVITVARVALRFASRLDKRNEPRSTIYCPRFSILDPPSSLLDEFILLAPALLVLILVSSQTGFNRHLRYVLPCFPFVFIWISQLGALLVAPHISGQTPAARLPLSTDS